MRHVQISLFLFCALALTACANVEGADCAGRCATGYACVPEQPSMPSGGTCMAECERRADCRGAQSCRASIYAEAARGVCVLGGTLGMGDRCSPGEGEPCSAGLACDGATLDCRPACDPRSPHSEDRACPAGSLCDGSAQSDACQTLCDPSDPDSCDPAALQFCVRFEHPTEGPIGLCVGSTGYWQYCPTIACAEQEVCVEDVCYPIRDAPPRAYYVSPEVPVLVD